MTLIYTLFFFMYLLIVLALTVGWERSITATGLHEIHSELLLTVVIPARNEEDNIVRLLEDIKNQSYKNFEVLVVNDHSDDRTEQFVLNLASQDSRFRLLQSRGEGKKQALTTGIQAGAGDIIVTTDADCRVGTKWIQTILQYFQDEKTQMVFGGVKIEGASFFSRLQSIEFLSLIGTAASTILYNIPSMCNGANLAFRRVAFFEVGGYANNMHIPSGDDEFLLRKIFQSYPQGVRFMGSEHTVVRTRPSATLKELAHQRIRWAGKWRHAMYFSNVLLAVFVFCFHLAVLALPFAMLTGLVSIYFGLAVFFVKAAGECVFLKKIAKFTKVRWDWPSFMLLQVIYPVYAVLIGAISTFSSFEWKGRRLKSLAVNVVKR